MFFLIPHLFKHIPCQMMFVTRGDRLTVIQRVPCGVGTAISSGAHEFTPNF
jgi:hypothetical protein